MKVICISGHARNGKDTVAEILRKYLWGSGKRVLILHYADLLKFMCRQLFHWNGEKDERGRHLLQYVGTDIVRAQQPDFWVDFVIQELALFRNHWDYVLIPDTRFPNEIERLKEAGYSATHLRVERKGFSSSLTEEQKQHASETALDDTAPDYVIENDGTMVELVSKILRFALQFCRDEGQTGGSLW